MIVFGPVPSRRLGRSLGINNIPPKFCSYSCVYCQVGPTAVKEIEPRTFYWPEDILIEVKERVEHARAMGESIDFLTFVPDGEPTLDINLGQIIKLLKPLDIKIAVISNGSLIWREDVRKNLSNADWVSLKIDAIGEGIWRQLNCPHSDLRLNFILEGMLDFAKEFHGELATETMLIKGLNDSPESVFGIGDFLAKLKPSTAYLSIPTRPPAEKHIHPPDEETVNCSYQILKGKLPSVEYLIGYEGNAFAFTGNIEKDLLSITSVHPMREEAVRALLKKADADWEVVQRLIREKHIKVTEFEEKKFLVRSFPNKFGS